MVAQRQGAKGPLLDPAACFSPPVRNLLGLPDEFTFVWLQKTTDLTQDLLIAIRRKDPKGPEKLLLDFFVERPVGVASELR